MAQTSIRSLLTGLGFTDLPSGSWYSRVGLWRQWYKGKTPWHTYRIYNGQKSQKCVRKTLKMAKKMAEDKSDLLLNEKAQITVLKDNQDTLNEVLAANDFAVQSNQLVEAAHALGTGAFVEYLEQKPGEDAEVKIDYIDDPLMIWPLSWSKKQVHECAFCSISYDAKQGKMFNISTHTLNARGHYVVNNYRFDKDGNLINLPEGVQPSWSKDSPIKMFQLVTPNIRNNLEEDCPMGISIYANSLDILKVLDAVYDSYFNEFILGRKRIFADASVLNVDMDPNSPLQGDFRPVFDPNDTVFYNYPGMESDKGKPIIESNMSLRVEEHKAALQDNLDLLSENVGFGKGYYKFTMDNVQTATGVIAQNSKLYRKVKKDELVLGATLKELARAVLMLKGLDPDQPIGVGFDDSIIEDTNSKIQRALLEFQSGAMDLVMYYMETRSLTKEKAIELVAEMEARQTTEPEPRPDDTVVIEESGGNGDV